MTTAQIFWDVDTQHDFMHEDGKLYVPDSESIIPELKRLTDFAHEHNIPIVASADDHQPNDRELSDTPDYRTTFPPHCMHGTPGQQKIAATTLRNPMVLQPEHEDPDALAARISAHDGDFLLLKRWFDVFTNENIGTLLDTLKPDHIVLYGVALDVCNRYAIEGLLVREPSATIWFVTDAARAIHFEVVDSLLEKWRSRGVHMVTTKEVLAGIVME